MHVGRLGWAEQTFVTVNVFLITSLITSWENSPHPKLLLLGRQKKSAYPQPLPLVLYQAAAPHAANSLTSCGGAEARETLNQAYFRVLSKPAGAVRSDGLNGSKERQKPGCGR